MIIDLRSDTVTKPSAAMLEAMMNAEVGDDVYGEDPTVNKLQQLSSDMFGMEAGLFCPSGTMTNQIAIKVHTQPGDELICADNAHIYKYEGGGIAFNSGVQARTIVGDRGRITRSQIEDVINSEDVHFPVTRLVCLENTHNRGGGSIYSLNEIKNIRALCDEKKIILHLDGARVFNALVESDYSAKDLGTQFHSISICLSKGLGTPIGSVLLGTNAFIHQAKRIRKVFGGGMRQAGFIAAAGIYALQNNIDRLKEDHKKAKQIAVLLSSKKWVKEVTPADTNVVIFSCLSPADADRFLYHLTKHEIKANKVSADAIRFVFHLDITDEMFDYLGTTISSFPS
jgi:threonine aldolase